MIVLRRRSPLIQQATVVGAVWYLWCTTIGRLQQVLADFAAERDWEQLHTPKNLAMALADECAELLEVFQWLTPEQPAEIMSDPAGAARVREEMADVFAYLLRLSSVLGVELEEALAAKIEINRLRYPVRLAKGRADKYTQLGG